MFSEVGKPKENTWEMIGKASSFELKTTAKERGRNVQDDLPALLSRR